jgi:hypothetical protein
VAELVDARDLKSLAPEGACRFDSGLGYHFFRGCDGNGTPGATFPFLKGAGPAREELNPQTIEAQPAKFHPGQPDQWPPQPQQIFHHIGGRALRLFEKIEKPDLTIRDTYWHI